MLLASWTQWAYCSNVYFQFVTRVCFLIGNSVAELMNDTRWHASIWMWHCIIQNWIMKVGYAALRGISSVCYEIHSLSNNAVRSLLAWFFEPNQWRVNDRGGNVAQATRKCSKAEDVNERLQFNCGSLSLVTTCCFHTIILLTKIITGLEE